MNQIEPLKAEIAELEGRRDAYTTKAEEARRALELAHEEAISGEDAAAERTITLEATIRAHEATIRRILRIPAADRAGETVPFAASEGR